MIDEKLDRIITILEKVKKSDNSDYTHTIRFAIIEGIDKAINGHRGTLDGVDMDRLHEERRRDDALQFQINTLIQQTAESRNQTKQIKKQTWYIIAAFIVTFVASTVSIIFSYLNYTITK